MIKATSLFLKTEANCPSGRYFLPEACPVRRKILACAIVGLLATLATAQDSDERDAASKVQALEKFWDRAEQQGDIRALDLIFDESMTYVDEDGSLLSKAEFLSRVVKEAGTQVQSLVTPALSVHVYGDTAVAIGIYTYKGVRKGMVQQREGRFIDTWVLKKGGWVCVVAQSTPILR
jgi:ketosteroid isomerase-like protein